MFITISKRQDDRYVFAVGDDPKADPGSWVRSDDDAAVLGDIPASFHTFGEAHAFASRLADDRPCCVLAKKASFYGRKADNVGGHAQSAENLTIAHYDEQVSLVEQRIQAAANIEGGGAAKEIEAVKKEVDGIKQEIGNILPLIEGESGRKRMEELSAKTDAYLTFLNKIKATKVASKSPMPMGLPKSAIRAFSEAAMMGILPKHSDAFVKSASFIPSFGGYEVVLASGSDGDLVKLEFDRNFLLSGVIPFGASLERCGGVGTVEFLAGYWEPIVSAVGHYHSRGHKIVAVASIARSNRFEFPGFDTSDNGNATLVINRISMLGKESWMAKRGEAVVSPVNTQIAIDDEVQCVAKRLPSYLGRTGIVTEVAEKEGRQPEYRVDFRRGLGIIWLESDDITKV